MQQSFHCFLVGESRRSFKMKLNKDIKNLYPNLKKVYTDKLSYSKYTRGSIENLMKLTYKI